MADLVPRTLAIAVAAALIGATTGYFVAVAAARKPAQASDGTSAVVGTTAPTATQLPAPEIAPEEVDSTNEDEEDSHVVPDDVELKMVFCVRHDLGMSKGKVAAQVGHAVLACWQTTRRNATWREWAKAWNYRAAAKITLVVNTLEQLEEIEAAATAAGLPHCVIEDAGRTEIAAGSRTVLGIGPAPKALIDKITGPRGSHPLKLLH